MGCTYLLPVRRRAFGFGEAEALRSYFNRIRTATAEIIVIDGSPPQVFKRHHQVWSAVCRHEPVNRSFGFLNDKVNGIQTGVRLATTNKIVLADDDIRYTASDIEQIAKLLDDFEVVRPQNYFAFNRVASGGREAGNPACHAAKIVCTTKPWSKETHWPAANATTARIEAARMLINRATLRPADYPGTCAFRLDTFLRAGDYDGDVLFDNEELVRHLARFGANICYANDFFVEKRPPSFRKWLEQRPRQAYEDFGLRTKTLVFALIPIVLVILGLWFGIRGVLWASLSIFGGAFISALRGRARGTARKFFPLHVCFFAPLWVFERSISTYWAFYWLLRHGGYPFGERLLKKGIGRDWVKGGRIASAAVAAEQAQK